MNERVNTKGPVLVAGNDKLAFSITVCLLLAGQKVNLYTQDEEKALENINLHFADIFNLTSVTRTLVDLVINTEISEQEEFKVAIVITNENLTEKKSAIEQLEKVLSPNAIIAINSESILLNEIQESSKYPARVIGAN